MNRKRIQLWLLITFFLVLLSLVVRGQESDATLDLPKMACQPEDVAADPPFVVALTETAVPPNIPLTDQIEDYYGVLLVENRLAYISAYCDLFILTDETAAAELLAHLCLSKMDEAEAPQVGEEACARQNEGLRQVSFRQGNVIVSILADSNGYGVDVWAKAVNGRLQEK